MCERHHLAELVVRQSGIGAVCVDDVCPVAVEVLQSLGHRQIDLDGSDFWCLVYQHPQKCAIPRPDPRGGYRRTPCRRAPKATAGLRFPWPSGPKLQHNLWQRFMGIPKDVDQSPMAPKCYYYRVCGTIKKKPFFVSIEQLNRPTLLGRPMLVGGRWSELW